MFLFRVSWVVFLLSLFFPSPTPSYDHPVLFYIGVFIVEKTGSDKHFAAIYDCRFGFGRNLIVVLALKSIRLYASLRLVKLMDLESDVDNVYEVEKILDAKRKVS